MATELKATLRKVTSTTKHGQDGRPERIVQVVLEGIASAEVTGALADLQEAGVIRVKLEEVQLKLGVA